MISAEERHQNIDGQDQKLIRIPFGEYADLLRARRRWLAKVAGVGLILSLAIALLLPNQYSSTAQLMPPDPQTFSSSSGSSVMSALTGSNSAVLPSSSFLMQQRSPGATAIGVLSSFTVQDDIINRFDLRSVYHCKLYIDARRKLAANTKLGDDTKTGIISITVKDRDPKRARDIAQAYVEELNRLINSLSTSSARREREFLDGRLKAIKSDLEASSVALSHFASSNATLDPGREGEVAVDTVARVQDQLMTAESDLSGLKAVYSEDNVRVREARARVGELESQLRMLGGKDSKMMDANGESHQLLPSVRNVPLLGVTYSDLYRQVNLDATLYETLTKQYELARVQEAMDIPPIKVLDAPSLAERKSSPHRAIIILAGTFLFGLGGAVWILVPKLWELVGN